MLNIPLGYKSHYRKAFYLKTADSLYQNASEGDKLIFDKKGSLKEAIVIRNLYNSTQIKFLDGESLVIDRNTFNRYQQRSISFWLSKVSKEAVF